MGWTPGPTAPEELMFFAVLSLMALILEMELRGYGTASEGSLT